MLQVLLIVSLGRGLWETLQSKRRIEQLKDKKERLVKEQGELTKEVEVVESEYYLEKIAREKLHLIKPGETVVLVGEGVIPDVLGSQDDTEVTRSNFAKWLDVLFGKD